MPHGHNDTASEDREAAPVDRSKEASDAASAGMLGAVAQCSAGNATSAPRPCRWGSGLPAAWRA